MDGQPELHSIRSGRPYRDLSADEALRALYIDFEGEKDHPPVLLGAHRRGRGPRPYVHAYVIDEAFAVFGDTALKLQDAIERIVGRAEARDRQIVAWSTHELTIVRELLADDPNLVARFEARFVNALALARFWRNKLHDGDRPEEGRLADYLALIGYEVPDEGLGGDVGATIRAIRTTLGRGAPPTSHQRERWRRLVEHNRHDCIGMRRLCIRATRELDEGRATGLVPAREARRAPEVASTWN
jgi:hypothetical protein